jgi:type IV secretory pathway TraG/TraD family ATPase VirD4
VWLDLFILRMMGYCDTPNVKPVWFVLDELASLNKLPQLHAAVTENRKYGNPVVMGFQGRSQLEKRYGQDAEVMLSQPATKIFFKTSEPRAAKWISDAIGEIEVERLKESRSMGLLRSKKSFAMEIATKPLVMPSEIAGLEPLHGYIKQGNRVVPAHLPYLKPKVKQLGFIERKMPVLVPRPAPQPAAPAIPTTPAVDQLEAPKKPVKKQPAFVPFSKQRAVNEGRPEWDESEWIE